MFYSLKTTLAKGEYQIDTDLNDLAGAFEVLPLSLNFCHIPQSHMKKVSCLYVLLNAILHYLKKRLILKEIWDLEKSLSRRTYYFSNTF